MLDWVSDFLSSSVHIKSFERAAVGNKGIPWRCTGCLNINYKPLWIEFYWTKSINVAEEPSDCWYPGVPCLPRRAISCSGRVIHNWMGSGGDSNYYLICWKFIFYRQDKTRGVDVKGVFVSPHITPKGSFIWQTLKQKLRLLFLKGQGCCWGTLNTSQRVLKITTREFNFWPQHLSTCRFNYSN